MSTKRVLASLLFAGLVGPVAAASSVAVSSSHQDAIVAVDAQGSFDAILKVTPTAFNELVLSFYALNGSYADVKYSFYGDAGLTSLVGYPLGNTIKTNVGSSTFGVTDTLIPFSDAAKKSFDLGPNAPVFVKITGTLNDSDNDGILKISSVNGLIAAVPEPESYAMLLAGLGIMGALVRRRRNID